MKNVNEVRKSYLAGLGEMEKAQQMVHEAAAAEEEVHAEVAEVETALEGLLGRLAVLRDRHLTDVMGPVREASKRYMRAEELVAEASGIGVGYRSEGFGPYFGQIEGGVDTGFAHVSRARIDIKASLAGVVDAKAAAHDGVSSTSAATAALTQLEVRHQAAVEAIQTEIDKL